MQSPFASEAHAEPGTTPRGRRVPSLRTFLAKEALSIDVRAHTHNAAVAAGPRVLEVAEGLVLELDAGDVAILLGSVVMVAKEHVMERHSLTFNVLPKDGLVLPGEGISLGPLVDLRPHGVHLEEPVLLIMPVRLGADKVWRSSDDAGKSWELLPEASFSFQAGHAILRLEHFCQATAGAEAATLQKQALTFSCFMHPTTFSTKFAIAPVGCRACDADFEAYSQEPDILEGFQRCRPRCPAGRYSHGEVLKLAFPDGNPQHYPEVVTLDFAHFPFISPKPWIAPGPTFHLQIGSLPCEFCCQPAMGTSCWLNVPYC